ncbi:MAG: TlpA family protein disulfide reductase [Kiritimatiellae bacterium]|nr:TlpA family protein disulfide reductase [Kiritimatiellia bacterium]
MKLHRLTTALLFAALALTPVARAQYDAELAPVLSRLQTLSHATHSQAEWDQALQALDEIDAKAAAAGQLDLVVQSRAIKAMALADMKRDPRAALRVIEDTKQRYGNQKVPSMKRIFIQEADYYGRLGDEDGARRAIAEFRKNPNFDPEQYPVELYEGRDTPMLITRPAAGANDSISVTAMEVARERAQFAPGSLFPDFQWQDAEGHAHSIRSLQGQVVLVDFWHQNWTPWSRALAQLQRTYDSYHGRGFEIVGIALDRNETAARAFAGQHRMTWPLVYGETELPRQLRLFGEVSNFLVDRNGVIIARNVRGSDLAALLQKALSNR